MRHEENGCEKVLWPFLENKGSWLHKNSGIINRIRQVKTVAVNIFFVKKNRN